MIASCVMLSEHEEFKTLKCNTLNAIILFNDLPFNDVPFKTLSKYLEWFMIETVFLSELSLSSKSGFAFGLMSNEWLDFHLLKNKKE